MDNQIDQQQVSKGPIGQPESVYLLRLIDYIATIQIVHFKRIISLANLTGQAIWINSVLFPQSSLTYVQMYGVPMYILFLLPFKMRDTKRVSMWPVGLSGGLKFEGPECSDGKVTGWNAVWDNTRAFQVDMAGLCKCEHPAISWVQEERPSNRA